MKSYNIIAFIGILTTMLITMLTAAVPVAAAQSLGLPTPIAAAQSLGLPTPNAVIVTRQAEMNSDGILTYTTAFTNISGTVIGAGTGANLVLTDVLPFDTQILSCGFKPAGTGSCDTLDYEYWIVQVGSVFIPAGYSGTALLTFQSNTSLRHDEFVRDGTIYVNVLSGVNGPVHSFFTYTVSLAGPLPITGAANAAMISAVLLFIGVIGIGLGTALRRRARYRN